MLYKIEKIKQFPKWRGLFFFICSVAGRSSQSEGALLVAAVSGSLLGVNRGYGRKWGYWLAEVQRSLLMAVWRYWAMIGCYGWMGLRWIVKGK